MHVDTICTHGDTPGSHELTRLLRAGLERAGVAVQGARRRVHASMTATRTRLDADGGLFGWWRAGTAGGAPGADRRRRSAGCSTRSTSCCTRWCSRRSCRSSGSDGDRGRCSARRRCSRRRPAASIFGVIADRFGRTRALMASVLIYSVFTAACGLAHNVVAARGLPRPARPRHGRRVGERRGARVGDVAGGASRQGARASCRARGRSATARAALVVDDRAAAVGLARGVLRRHPAGVLHAVGPAERRGAGALARAPGAARTRATARAVRRHLLAPACCGVTVAADAHERLHDVRLVGVQSVAARATCRCRPPRAASGSRHDDDDVVHHRHAGRDVVRLRHVRVRQRRLRPQARSYVVYTLTAAVLILVYVSVRRRRSRCCCSGPSWRFSRRGISAGLAR